MAYGWRNQLAVGAAGEARVVDWLEAQGYTVADVTKDKDWQRRDVDFLVVGTDGAYRTVEVKTDTHKTEAIFIETSVDEKPGYIFKTRAEVLLYYMSATGKLYWIDVPKLCRYVFTFGNLYDLKVVASRSGKREWQAEGIVVKVETLKTHGVLEEYSLTA